MILSKTTDYVDDVQADLDNTNDQLVYDVEQQPDETPDEKEVVNNGIPFEVEKEPPNYQKVKSCTSSEGNDLSPSGSNNKIATIFLGTTIGMIDDYSVKQPEQFINTLEDSVHERGATKHRLSSGDKELILKATGSKYDINSLLRFTFWQKEYFPYYDDGDPSGYIDVNHVLRLCDDSVPSDQATGSDKF